MTDSWIVSNICTGTARPFRGDEKSAFAKYPVEGPVRITKMGIEGDEQADRKHHGGSHMAVHHYPRDHADFWRGAIGEHALLDDPGAFGTNLAVTGLTESAVKLGDRFRCGSAILETSQPRMPCWKIEHRFQKKAMVAKIIKTGRSGWYYRVIEEGTAQAGDRIERISTGATDWTIERVILAIAYPKTVVEIPELEAMAANELLGPSWRSGAQKKIDFLQAK